MSQISDLSQISEGAGSDPQALGAICADCAEAAGGVWPEGHVSTWWHGRCGACGEAKGVTSPADFLWPRQGKTALKKSFSWEVD